MQGQITKYRPDLGIGVIASESGHRFRFSTAALVNPDAHLLNADVDFETREGRASDVILLRGDPWTVFGTAARV